MNFDWNLKEHHKLCMDEGLTVRSYGNPEYAMAKDEEGKYSLFEVKQEFGSNGEEIWERIASSKCFYNFKRKLIVLFMEGGNDI
ncbi:hypothetical protein [uncultured Clostridium sp.]|uniref:hypothetical protein n=1 Tax=uncultured Clostridium sp. TaxID=59620 RepID=UPI002632DD53|nr:hypothetical protein [uncultured Clostridium sp.]